jgi:deazaflavin-dependent oxidoreductase (nitroreductase family)
MTSRIYREARPLQRAVRRTAGTRPLAWLYCRIQQPLDSLVYRLTRGRTMLSTLLSGVELVMLTTTGARTGQRRTLPVLGLNDGDAVVLIASNYGRPRHPAWYHNLRADPRASVAIRGVERAMEAHELAGPERERWLRRGAEMYPGFDRYPTWTARTIPVVRLEPLRAGRAGAARPSRAPT